MLFHRLGLAAFASLASFVYASTNAPPTLSIVGPAFTSKWIEGSNYIQVVEMSIKNTHASNHLTLADALDVTLTSSGVNLVQAGTLVRLAPGDSSIVQLGVQPKSGFKSGTTCSATITATWGASYGKTITTTSSVTGPCGIPQYTASKTSLGFHTSPDWYNEVKYGIFIHWGLYAAPAYGSTGANEFYAEWYWNSMHSSTSKTQTYQYHEKTYGENFNYDDFLSNFTAANFNAKNWVQLIADAGAQYMVPVTKHHDGWALFNFSTSITKRSVAMTGPKRDFIGELLSAAKTYQPQIRRGTYFSLPEWYNPAYTRYANGAFSGGPPKNPYTGATLTYTGYVDVNDFVLDIQVPQMNALAYNYDTEIMWCDIGGANNSTIVMSEWFNWAYTQGRQVTFNNRCGPSGDFTTPEYTTNSNTVTRKWESNRGMDPDSFGYNYQTPDSGYLTASDIVHSLIDIISKNGNFLLDIGPEHDGTIKAIMQTNLREAGTWIKAHGESIFKTRYYARTPGTGNFRYTQTQNAFYIHYLTSPPASLAIPDAVPYLPGDVVTIVGGSMSGTVIPTTGGYGNLGLTLSSAIRASDQFIWTFKITWKSDGAPTTTTTTTKTTGTTTKPPVTTAPSGSCSAHYGQCGGTGYTGPTCCTASSCTYSNPYYSQCL